MYWQRYYSLTTGNICQLKQIRNFRVILHHVVHQLYYNKVDIRVQCHFTIIAIYFESFWYINQVYRLFLKCSNLLMTHISNTARKQMGRGVTNSVLGCIWWLLEILAAFFSKYWSRATFSLTFYFLKNNSPMKRVCPFNAHGHGNK